MKTYVKPELEETLFTVADIIQTSEEEIVPLRLKTVVNNVEGTDYGSTEVSLID